MGLALTALATLYLRNALNDRNDQRLTSIAKDVSEELASAVNIITYGLGGANGVYAASKSVEHDEFRRYVASRNLPVEFPGVFGFGFIQYVERAQLAQFVAAAKKDEQPDFHVTTSGNLPDLFVTRFIEPVAINKKAVGFDIGSEQHRRDAAETAMHTGRPTISRRIQLITDDKNQAGFLYLRPVFKKDSPISNPKERKAALLGWVYAPFTLEKVLLPLIERFGEMVSVSVYEGDKTISENHLYSTNLDKSIDSYERDVSIVVGQQPWTITIHPTKAFFAQNAFRFVPITAAFIGILLSVIVSGLTWTYLSAKHRTLASKLQEGENFIRGILDSSSSSIIVTDPSGLIKVFNRAATEMLGYTAPEMVNTATPQMIHDPAEIVTQAKVISNRLGRQIEPGLEVFMAESREDISNETEWSYIRKDGSRFPVTLSVTAIRNVKGEVVAFMGMASDISKRKQAEQELLQSEERFRTSFDYATHGMALVGVDGKWLRVNRALCGIVGHSEKTLLTKTFQDITHPDDLDADIVLANDTLAGKIDNYHMEKRYIHASGGIVWVSLSVSLVREPDGTPVHFVSQIQDITARKATEHELGVRTTELILAKKIAENAAESKSQFLANMSHEIRTPLTSIIGYSESLMADSLTDGEAEHAIGTIIKNGNHLLGVINDILDLSKVEAGKLDVEIVTVSLCDLISDISNLMLHKAHEKGLPLGFDYVGRIPRTISTDPIRLKQILINLVGNAVKFTSTGGVKINVTYKPNEGRLEFAIVDTGPGMNLEQQSKLFQAFSQADTSITRRFGGTGLGLVISNELAHKLGGEITVESEEGKGSTFTLSIFVGTIADSELINSISRKVLREVPVKVDVVPDLRGSVLVAEDGEDNRGLISFLLRKTGVDFSIVENGALALERATAEKFDLILMDIQMPVMDGYSATAAIRERGIAVPIIALTANAMKADVQRAQDAGCTDFLGKPFTRSELFAKLSHYLSPAKVNESPNSEISGTSADHTISLVKDDPEMLTLILNLIHNLPTRLEEILRAAKADDLDKASLVAHSLRGICGNIGLTSIAQAAGSIETAANNRDRVAMFSNFDELESLIDEAQKLDGILQTYVD